VSESPLPTRLPPTTTPDTQFFWDGLRERRLLVQRCDGCACCASAATDVPAVSLARVDADRVDRAGDHHVGGRDGHPQYPWFETDPVRRPRGAGGRVAASSRTSRASHRRTTSWARAVAVGYEDFEGRPDPADLPGRDVVSVDGASVQVGDELPPLVLDVTATVIAAGGDRDSRLHARASRPRLRAGAGCTRHLHEHPLRHRLLQPLPDRLGRSRREGAQARDPTRVFPSTRATRSRTPAR